MNATIQPKRQPSRLPKLPDPTTVNERKIQNIQILVARYYHRSPLEMTSPGREEPLATIRQVAMALSRRFVPADLVEIARAFSRKDHGTVRHAVKAIEEMKAQDPVFSAEIAVINAQIVSQLKLCPL